VGWGGEGATRKHGQITVVSQGLAGGESRRLHYAQEAGSQGLAGGKEVDQHLDLVRQH
jgi:hypothetical protein